MSDQPIRWSDAGPGPSGDPGTGKAAGESAGSSASVGATTARNAVVVGRSVVGRSVTRRSKSRAQTPPEPQHKGAFEEFVRGIDWARFDPMSPTDCLRTPVDDLNYNGG